MFTQCPHCETVFRVSAGQLRGAQGRVRCGQCQGAFDALAHLYEQVPDSKADLPTEPTAVSSGWDTEETDDTPYMTASRDDDHDWNPAAQDAADIGVPVPARPLTDTSAPPVAILQVDQVDVLQVQMNQDADGTAVPRHTLAWSGLALLLFLTLTAQYVFFTRATLAQHEPLRPWLQRLCGFAGCGLPLRRATDRIELMERGVISHPRIRDALLINATFVNQAAFAQAYPVLQIRLSSESGATVAMRRFQPEEYLAPGVAIAAGMLPGAPVHVVLEVAEPSRSASSFQFDFL